MLDFPRWKVWAVTLTILVGILLAIPSLLPKDQVERWPAWLPSARINLGLDIAGGSQLLLEADIADAGKRRLRRWKILSRPSFAGANRESTSAMFRRPAAG